MKRWKAAACAVLAGLMLAGCGSKEVITCRAEGPAAAVDLTQYGRISARQNRVCPCQSMVV